MDAGLKPCEIDEMTASEFAFYLHGFNIRHDKPLEAIRRLFVSFHNANYQRKFSGIHDVHQTWPLYIDKLNGNAAQKESEYYEDYFKEFKIRRDNAKRRAKNNSVK